MTSTSQDVRGAYEELGLRVGASVDEIKKQYKVKALHLHPDRHGGSHDGFLKVNKAYETLLKFKERSSVVHSRTSRRMEEFDEAWCKQAESMRRDADQRWQVHLKQHRVKPTRQAMRSQTPSFTRTTAASSTGRGSGPPAGPASPNARTAASSGGRGTPRQASSQPSTRPRMSSRTGQAASTPETRKQPLFGSRQQTSPQQQQQQRSRHADPTQFNSPGRAAAARALLWVLQEERLDRFRVSVEERHGAEIVGTITDEFQRRVFVEQQAAFTLDSIVSKMKLDL